MGGILGYVLRPSVPLLGQLPFQTVITAGSNLTGLDQILKPLAEQSFEYLVGGVILGGVAGLLIGRTRRPALPPAPPMPYAPPVQPTNAYCQSCGSAVPAAVPFCPYCGNRRA